MYPSNYPPSAWALFCRHFTAVVLAGLALIFIGLPVFSVEALARGTIEGRVASEHQGGYLEKVHLTLDGTTLGTFTDADGFYRLPNVPAGPRTLRAFFTGLRVQTNAVTVAAGQIVRLDITLVGTGGQLPAGRGGDPITLDQFVVGASRPTVATSSRPGNSVTSRKVMWESS